MANSSWFTHDRFGLFIHWGIYSLPAAPRVDQEPRADFR